MSPNASPQISVVLATHNRREAVVHTLQKLHECGFPRERMEIVVVDNASTDGTKDAIQGVDRLISLRKNRGSCAKAFGVDVARRNYVVFLDDDSFPRSGSLERMIEHFESDPTLGSAAFQVHLPDGSRESSALPGVFVGCGVGFRARALRAVGGLDRTFFMQAEEYDLSFRLASAGWRVEVLDDLHVEHLKTKTARRSARTAMYDICNNLRVIARYLPPRARKFYCEDWIARYRWLAEREDHIHPFRRGRFTGNLLAFVERPAYWRFRLTPQTFERFFQWDFVEDRMRELRSQGIRRVLFADLGKNVYAYRRGAEQAGIEVVAIADDRFAAPNRIYRAIPLVTLNDARGMEFDAVIVSNMSTVHAEQSLERLRRGTEKPVYSWFHGSTDTTEGTNSPHPTLRPDDISACEVVAGYA
ncbi:MAG: glycosyltransferase family 2 protein [Planctomycetes bacterium]|nr:glycosyltransferase family 2 protein [Planctomycetota bacterium]MBI3832981.1 glycosyltransferase family 2 protein [Planctomycetota bacterium]